MPILPGAPSRSSRTVLAEIDLLKPRIIISPYPHDVYIGVGQEQAVADARTNVAKMLVGRGVLMSAEYFHDRNPYAEPDKEGILITADREPAQQAHDLLRERLYGPPARPPVQRPLPAPVEAVKPEPNVAATPAPPRVARRKKPDRWKDASMLEMVKLPFAVLATVIAALIVQAVLKDCASTREDSVRQRAADPKAAAESTATDSSAAHKPPR